MASEATIAARAGTNQFLGLAPKFDALRRSALERKKDMKSPRSESNFKVVVGYENLEAGERALSLLDELVRSFNPLDELDVTAWNFDRLSDPESLDGALAEASEADLIVFSSNRPKSIPSAGETWLKLSLNSKTREATSVIVLLHKEETWKFSIQAKNEISDAQAEEYMLRSGHVDFKLPDSLLFSGHLLLHSTG